MWKKKTGLHVHRIAKSDYQLFHAVRTEQLGSQWVGFHEL
jgi:hypothetical protein